MLYEHLLYPESVDCGEINASLEKTDRGNRYGKGCIV